MSGDESDKVLAALDESDRALGRLDRRLHRLEILHTGLRASLGLELTEIPDDPAAEPTPHPNRTVSDGG
jgi:hypothetical protein